MNTLYQEKTANYPRLKTDTFFADYQNTYRYSGFMDDLIRYIEAFQLTSPAHWRRFVEQFRADSDYEAGWRGEYWGKMMRGACFVYSYTRNPELYGILTQTVSDMMDSADETGRISSYGVNHEFDGWDLWCRKYVLLGMQYYLEICTDDAFAAKVVASMCGQVDYIMSRVGRPEEGKKHISKCTRNWRGINSSSILEPIVRLYSLTGEKKYLDYAAYIVDSGGADIVNIFDLAFEDNFAPYQYPVTKAYEMTSCFEGLLEYYRITGNERYKTAVLRFADKVLKTDFTVIGSSGCTHELFDHSTIRQANTTNEKIMQETCVTVTIMKFMYQLHLLTGNSKYVDAFETSLYNAYIGAVNTEKVVEPMILRDHPDWHIEPLPFDSYSPLTAGTRGNGIGGLKLMSDNHYYGCCACIGSAGFGLVPKMQLMTAKDGFALNLYINGTIETKTMSGNPVRIDLHTDYPKTGTVKIIVTPKSEERFTLRLRNPAWSRTTSVSVNGEEASVQMRYIVLNRLWKPGDSIKLSLDMRTQAVYPIAYGSDIVMNHVAWAEDYMIATYDKEDPLASHHIALRRGPVMLAQENRLGYSVDDPISVAVGTDDYVELTAVDESKIPYPCMMAYGVPLTDGSVMTVTDYASAGKLWTEESKMAVWMLTEEQKDA